jgi:choline/glycine/proline betaine transport protein
MKSFDLYAYDKPRLAGRLDGVLLGLVDCLVAVRGPVHRAHFPWPHHPRIVFGVLLIPLGFTLAWMSIFGNSAMDQVLNHGMSRWACRPSITRR